MTRGVKNTGRFLLVTIGIIFLTSFTIDATDMLSGSQSALSILADRATGDCPKDMVVVDGPTGRFCVDSFEASVGENCSVQSPKALAETAQNVNDVDCLPESAATALPWTYVAKHQAEALCARAGKRLPTASEWYLSALGTPDGESCNVESTLRATEKNSCVSGAGAYDMIGNVWELVASSAIDGELDGKRLPEEGYVKKVSEGGIPIESAKLPDVVFNNDYVWTEPSGEFAVMRGGYHGGKDDAGVYAMHAKIDQNFSSPAIGFRCAMSI